MSIVASENLGIECNNDIMVETAESDDGIVKPSSSSRMRGQTQKLFVFDVKYIYL